ncbi:hypothetical protein F2P81_007132 [Scophthalmus maximus]|uniref:Uncharacterized protein n=1 Tax=Scophthalmus maximus TaxID=52904 RepID=A0A6A4TDH9_SCOMX|nr:hypothetical protein F2P81_007132 [Scophthalmus maximus]
MVGIPSANRAGTTVHLLLKRRTELQCKTEVRLQVSRYILADYVVVTQNNRVKKCAGDPASTGDGRHEVHGNTDFPLPTAAIQCDKRRHRSAKKTQLFPIN